MLLEHPSIQAAAVNVVEFGNLKEIAAYVVVARNVRELDRQEASPNCCAAACRNT